MSAHTDPTWSLILAVLVLGFLVGITLTAGSNARRARRYRNEQPPTGPAPVDWWLLPIDFTETPIRDELAAEHFIADALDEIEEMTGGGGRG